MSALSLEARGESFPDRLDNVGHPIRLTEDDLDNTRCPHRGFECLLVSGREHPGGRLERAGLLQKLEEIPVALVRTREVVDDQRGLVMRDEGNQIEGAVLDVSQVG